ncbi:sensor histidine kinase [Glaciecola sp. 1036]|uniref:sensor histidine kinase n=1 Tax=Alteromonadaceae TaxID=72275 RepID=UPI003CFC5081
MKLGSAKNISLATYVFTLLGAFLIVMAIVQLSFIYFIQGRIADEIADKSLSLSTEVIELVMPEAESKTEKDEVEEADPEQELTEKVTQYETHFVKKVIRNWDESSRIEMENELGKLEHEFAFGKLNEVKIEKSEGNVFVISLDGPERRSQVIQFDNNKSSVNRYFQLLSGATLAFGLLSLLFAYWLSRHVTKPLSRLALGFSNLSQGKFNTVLAEDGVREVKLMLQQFNQTSKRLSQLQAMEHKFQQQQQLAELGEISRGLAHSLRNPLHTIGLSIDEMRSAELSEDERLFLANQARKKITALDRTIKSLLLLTTSGLDRSQDLSLKDVVEDAVMQISMGHQHAIDVEVIGTPCLQGSATELAAVVTTLLSNAVEASKNGESIHVKLYETDTDFVLEVIDKGEGLSPSIADKLFQPSITSKAEGAGMGLYIAQRIVQLHYNGIVTLENNNQGGCTASIMFAKETHA